MCRLIQEQNQDRCNFYWAVPVGVVAKAYPIHGPVFQKNTGGEGLPPRRRSSPEPALAPAASRTQSRATRAVFSQGQGLDPLPPFLAGRRKPILSVFWIKGKERNDGQTEAGAFRWRVFAAPVSTDP